MNTNKIIEIYASLDMRTAAREVEHAIFELFDAKGNDPKHIAPAYLFKMDDAVAFIEKHLPDCDWLVRSAKGDVRTTKDHAFFANVTSSDFRASNGWNGQAAPQYAGSPALALMGAAIAYLAKLSIAQGEIAANAPKRPARAN